MKTTTTVNVSASLEQFLKHYQREYRTKFNCEPRCDHDPQWRSPCEVGEPDASNRIQWVPTAQISSSLAGCEHALEITLHPDIVQYYTSFWFPPLGAQCTDGELELIGIWNTEDLQQLQANLIGHALQQRQRKQSFSVFFATTLPESEYYLAVDNASGQVILEEAGQVADRIIAPSLGIFLQSLQPHLIQ